MFRALVVDNNGGTVTASMQTVSEASLPAGNVLVGVECSTVNYKDGLVVTGAGGLVKRYPHVPGVDFIGTSSASSQPLRFLVLTLFCLTAAFVGRRRKLAYA